MTLTKKLTIALNLFKSLNKCYSTNEQMEFNKLRFELLESGVNEEEFEELMDTVYNN